MRCLQVGMWPRFVMSALRCAVPQVGVWKEYKLKHVVEWLNGFNYVWWVRLLPRCRDSQGPALPCHTHLPCSS